MLQFNPADPFPLLPSSMHTYAQEQMHSEAVDRWLGMRIAEIEQSLMQAGCRLRAPGSSREHQQLWFGLDTRSLLTPYTEIRRLLNRISLRAGATVVDLGAGYGRMGFAIGRHYPGVRFIGYEYVGERVNEGKRCLVKHGFVRATLDHADLASPKFTPVAADCYFIYDYGTPKAIEKTLHDLRRIAQSRPITLVGRGRNCRYAIESRHSWLKPLFPSEGEGRATFYRSDPSLACELGTEAGL